jgi:hypothetical protein
MFLKRLLGHVGVSRKQSKAKQNNNNKNNHKTWDDKL